MPSKETGTVSAWTMARPGKRNAEGYGFVQIDGQEDSKASNLFLYADNIKDSKLRSEAKLFGLKNGTRISFRIEEPKSSRQSRLATEVEPLRDGGGGGGGGGGRGGGGDRDRGDRGDRGGRGRSRSRSRRRRSPSRRRRSPSTKRRRSPSIRRPSRRSPSQEKRGRSQSRSRSRSRSGGGKKKSPPPSKRSPSRSRSRRSGS